MKNNESLGSRDANPHGEDRQTTLKVAYEAPRVLSDQVFVSLSCSGPPNFNEASGCPCP